MLRDKVKSKKTCGRKFWFCCVFIPAFYVYSFAEGQFAYDAAGKRNPFIPLVTSDGRLLQLDKEKAKGDLAIEGIIYDKQGMSYAIVNGEVVGVGDMVEDYQVLKIEDGKVLLIKDGCVTEAQIEKEEE